MSDLRLNEIKDRAEKIFKNICEVCKDTKKFRMSIPPQADDTDCMVSDLTNKDIPYLVDKISLLERKLELCKEQRNQYIDTVIWEFYYGPNAFEDEIKKTIDDDDKVIEGLK